LSAEPIQMMRPAKALELLEIEARTDRAERTRRYRMPTRTALYFGTSLSFVTIGVDSFEFIIGVYGCADNMVAIGNQRQPARFIHQDVHGVQDLLTVAGNVAVAMYTEYQELQKILARKS